MRREKGHISSNISVRQKSEYVTQLKIKVGCVLCGFSDEKMPRFLELDHLNPSDKLKAVSQMVIQHKYTMNDVREECKKCRVLFRKHCHIIHTCKQRQASKLHDSYYVKI